MYTKEKEEEEKNIDNLLRKKKFKFKLVCKRDSETVKKITHSKKIN